MIEINLRPGLKRKRAGASPLAALGDRFKALGSTVKDPMMLLAGGAWAVALLFLVGTWLVGQRQLSVLEPKLVETRAEHERFRNFVAAKRREELIRDSVLSQISTIRQVDGERYIWAHVLDEVARALPAYTWLTNVSAQPQVIVAMRGQDEDALTDHGEPAHEVSEDLAVAAGGGVADGVGEVDGGRAGLDDGGDDLLEELQLCAAGVFGGEFDIAGELQRLFDRSDAQADDLLLAFTELVLAVDL